MTNTKAYLALGLAAVAALTGCPYSDSEAPAAPRFARAGEGIVHHTLPTITLEGTAEYGATLTLSSDTSFGGLEAPAKQVADPYTAQFTYPKVGLAAGKNTFTLVAEDEAGNKSPAATLVVEYVDEPDAIVLTLGSTIVTSGAEGVEGTLHAVAHLEGAEGFKVEGRKVVFAVTGVQTEQKDATTDATGRAEVSFSTFATAGAGTMTATFGGRSDTQSFAVLKGPAAALTLKLAKVGATGEGSNPLTVAAGEDVAATATIKDANGNTLPAPVSIFTDAPGAVVSGQRITNLRTAGTFRVVAAVSGVPTAGGAAVSDVATLVVTAANGSKVVVEAPATAVAGETVSFGASLTDAFGNAITPPAGQTLTVEAVGDAEAVVSNANHNVVFKHAGTTRLVATLSGTTAVVGEASVKVLPGAPATLELAFSGTARRTTPTYDVDADASGAIVVAPTVKDAFGNVVTTGVRLTTDSGGQFDGNTLRGLTKAGSFEVRGEVLNTLVGARKGFNVLAARGATLQLELSSNATEAGVAVTYAVRALDAFGNAATDAVVVSVDTLSPTEAVVNDALRTLTVKKSSDTPWTVRARAVAAGSPIPAVTAALAVRPAAPATLTLDVAGNNIYAAGATPALTITVKDAFLNTIANAPLSVAIVPQDATVVEPPGPVYGGGKIYNLIRPGTYKVVAQVAGTALVSADDAEALLTVTAGPSASVDLVLARAVADAQSPVDFRVFVRDAYGNPTSDAATVSVLQGTTTVAASVLGTSWTPAAAGTFTLEAKVTAVTPNLVDRELLVVSGALDLTPPTIAFERPFNDPTIDKWPPTDRVAIAGCTPNALGGDTVKVSASDESLIGNAWLRVSGAATQLGAAPVVQLPTSTYSAQSNGVCATPTDETGTPTPPQLVKGEVLVEFAANDLRGNYRTAMGSWCVDAGAANYQPTNSAASRCAVEKGSAAIANGAALAANEAGDLALARDNGALHLFDRSTSAYGVGAAHALNAGAEAVTTPRGVALVSRLALTSGITATKAVIVRTSALTKAGGGTDDTFVEIASTATGDRFDGVAMGADGALYAIVAPKSPTTFTSKLYRFDKPLDLAQKYTALTDPAVATSTSLRLSGLCRGARAGEWYATGQTQTGSVVKAVVAKIAAGTITTVFTDTVDARSIGGCALTAAGLVTTLWKGTGAGLVTTIDVSTGTLATLPLLSGYAAASALDKPIGVTQAGPYVFALTTETTGSLLRFARPGGF